MEKLKPLLPFLLLMMVAIPVIVWLTPTSDPYGGLRLEKDAEGMTDHSRALLDSLGIPTEGLLSDIDLGITKPLVRQMQEEFGLGRSNELLRSSIPGYFWNVRWTTPEDSNSESSRGNKTREQRIIEILRGRVSLQLSPGGKLLKLERRIPDTLALPSLSVDEARDFAQSVLQRYGSIPEGVELAQPASGRTIDMSNRSDHEFSWSVHYPPLKNSVQVKVLVSGNALARIETDFNVPEDYSKDSFESGIQTIIVFFSAVIIIGMIVMAFRRFRSFELGFRVAIALGIAAALWVGLEIYLSTSNERGWELLLSMFFGPLFVGGGLMLIWAVSESVARETWNEKFISLDLLTHGHVFHSRIGISLLRGVAVGLGSWALWLLMIAVVGLWTPVWLLPSGENILKMFKVPTPSLIVFAHNFYASAYVLTLFVLFSVSFLRRFLSSPVLLILGSALALGLMSQGDIFPLSAGIILHIVVSAFIIWSFYRYDVLTAFMAIYTMAIARDSGGLWMAGHVDYTSAAMVIAVFFGVLVATSVAAQFRRNEITDFDTIVPVFAKHITERQRLQQELEIARQVQMSFLPKSDPRMRGLDIASRCVPALEVGGDYYDFVPFGPTQLGVAIGDVSGKGTQAAFYMTLAKGFLRALSTPTGSVSEVLKQINKLFYDNVERGAFISMVYGIFNMGKKNLCLTRAGHNPVLVWRAKKQKLEVIQPNGLALGLEDGRKFSKTIQEVKVSFAKGDCFVFFTDGFTEAMNKNKEEYGDERFAATVQNYVTRSAKEMLEGILGDVRAFIGKAKQHDDMTIVVVKIV